MERENIINNLWSIAKPDPDRCKSCKHENACAMRGCAIIRAAIQEIEELSSHNKVLQQKNREVSPWIEYTVAS